MSVNPYASPQGGDVIPIDEDAEKKVSPELFLETQSRHFRQCRFEAIIVGIVWLVALAWCTTSFVTMGYVPTDRRPDVPDMVFGIPSWVFWGLYMPWLVLIGVTWWFAAFVLKDDEPYADMPEGEIDDSSGE